MSTTHRTLALLGMTVASALPAFADDQPKEAKADVDAYAITLIERAAKFLGEAEHFSVDAEIWTDTVIDGKLLQFDKHVEMLVRRPDGVRINISTVEPTRSIYYNGKTITMVDYGTHFYATADTSDNIDDMIEAVDEQYEVEFPMEDLLFSNPFGNAAEKAVTGQYLGKTVVLGVECDHVAFQHPVVDWQAWIQTGPEPVLRKVVIDYHDKSVTPRVTSIFSDWDFLTPMPDFLFEFTPLSYQKKIDAAPRASATPDAK